MKKKIILEKKKQHEKISWMANQKNILQMEWL